MRLVLFIILLFSVFIAISSIYCFNRHCIVKERHLHILYYSRYLLASLISNWPQLKKVQVTFHNKCLLLLYTL